jgi:hypothetical protein
MDFFVDFAAGSLNKAGEELCGDKVEFFRSKEGVIAVLSDGLGSGVKANILATLTAKIAITMLKEGLSIEEVVETVIHTLPVCQVRKLAYSTFTIVKIQENGDAYVIEFDNPGMFFLRNGQVQKVQSEIREVNGRKIKESNFKIEERDTLVFVSDGVIHAGAGMILNLGWGWKDVASYLEDIVKEGHSSKEITNKLLGACDALYMEKPGDDTTVVTLKAVKPKIATIFAGPPVNQKYDEDIVKALIQSKGKKIVCGGTAAQIVAGKLGREIETNFNYVDRTIPPTASIEGIDLVTEGVLTIKAAVERLEKVKSAKKLDFLYEGHGAAQLARLLFEECTHLKMLIGRAINPAHQNPDFPEELSIKLQVLRELQMILESLGKIVEVEYY